MVFIAITAIGSDETTHKGFIHKISKKKFYDKGCTYLSLREFKSPEDKARIRCHLK